MSRGEIGEENEELKGVKLKAPVKACKEKENESSLKNKEGQIFYLQNLRCGHNEPGSADIFCFVVLSYKNCV